MSRSHAVPKTKRHSDFSRAYNLLKSKNQKDTNAALEIFTKILKNDKEKGRFYADVYVAIARCHEALNDINKAIEMLTAILNKCRTKEDRSVYKTLVVMHLTSYKVNKEELHLDKANALLDLLKDEDDRDVLMHRCDISFLRGHNCESYLEKIEQMYPNDAVAKRFLIGINKKTKNRNETQRISTSLAIIHPNSVREQFRNLRALGIAAKKKDENLNEIIAKLREIKLSPEMKGEMHEVELALARVLNQNREFEEARELCEKTIKNIALFTHSAFWDAYIILAAILIYQDENFQEAYKLLDKIFSFNPKDHKLHPPTAVQFSSAHFFAAELYFKQGNKHAAEGHLANVDPSYAAAESLRRKMEPLHKHRGIYLHLGNGDQQRKLDEERWQEHHGYYSIPSGQQKVAGQADAKEPVAQEPKPVAPQPNEVKKTQPVEAKKPNDNKDKQASVQKDQPQKTVKLTRKQRKVVAAEAPTFELSTQNAFAGLPDDENDETTKVDQPLERKKVAAPVQQPAQVAMPVAVATARPQRENCCRLFARTVCNAPKNIFATAKYYANRAGLFNAPVSASPAPERRGTKRHKR